MDVAAEFAAQTAVVKKLWISSRRSQLATLSAVRCESAAPLLGADLRRAVAVERPVADVSLLPFKLLSCISLMTPSFSGDVLKTAADAERQSIVLMPRQVHVIAAQPQRWLDVPDALLDAVRTYARRAVDMEPQIREFMFVIPKARACALQRPALSHDTICCPCARVYAQLGPYVLLNSVVMLTWPC